jgi:hypothetical protein
MRGVLVCLIGPQVYTKGKIRLTRKDDASYSRNNSGCQQYG